MNIQSNTGEGPSALHWYAVYTRSRAEKKAAEDLLRKGIECYLPIKKVRKVWTTRTRVVDFPLISCYLFVRVDHRRYYDVLMTPGLMWYVCFNGKPAIIPDRQIRSLMVLEKAMNESLVVTSDHIEKADLIEVLSGPLAGVQGEVVRIKGKNHLVLRFRTLGCCIHVSQEALHFRKIERQNSSVF